MIKTYELTVAESRYKTLIVNAENESAAEHLAEDAYNAGEYGFEGEPEFEVIGIKAADGTLYEVSYPVCIEDEDCDDDNMDDFIFDDEDEAEGADEDIIFTCERCKLKESCNNETKLRHMLDMLLGEFMERVDMVCATYGEDQ